jgi:hypothetical protein
MMPFGDFSRRRSSLLVLNRSVSIFSDYLEQYYGSPFHMPFTRKGS